MSVVCVDDLPDALGSAPPQGVQLVRNRQLRGCRADGSGTLTWRAAACVSQPPPPAVAGGGGCPPPPLLLLTSCPPPTGCPGSAYISARWRAPVERGRPASLCSSWTLASALSPPQKHQRGRRRLARSPHYRCLAPCCSSTLPTVPYPHSQDAPLFASDAPDRHGDPTAWRPGGHPPFKLSGADDDAGVAWIVSFAQLHAEHLC